MMKAIVPLAIEVMSPIPAALIVVRAVVCWPIPERSNHSNAWQANADATRSGALTLFQRELID
jgi:hypothetical protein